MSETDRDAWHKDEAALADDWTVPCSNCGEPVTEQNSGAVMTAKAAGTERVVARRAWHDEDACFEDVMSRFGKGGSDE